MQSVMSGVGTAVQTLIGTCDADQDAGGLASIYAQVTDPRDARGRRHSLSSILMLMQSAVVAGATTWAAIRHWVAAAP